MKEVINYIENNKENFVNELIEFLRIPSISNNPENKHDMVKCAEWVRDNMKKQDSKISKF